MIVCNQVISLALGHHDGQRVSLIVYSVFELTHAQFSARIIKGHLVLVLFIDCTKPVLNPFKHNVTPSLLSRLVDKFASYLF